MILFGCDVYLFTISRIPDRYQSCAKCEKIGNNHFGKLKFRTKCRLKIKFAHKKN